MSGAYLLYQLSLARKTPKRYTITRLKSTKSSICDNQHLESHLLTYSWSMQFTKQGLLVPLHFRLDEASEWSKDSPIKRSLQWGDMSHEMTKAWVTIWKAAQFRKEWKQCTSWRSAKGPLAHSNPLALKKELLIQEDSQIVHHSRMRKHNPIQDKDRNS